MRRIIRNTKRLFLAVAIITLFGAVACSGENTPTPSVPITMYPPTIYFVDTNVDDASGTTEGFNVSFYVDTNEFSYTESAHVIYYYDVNPPTKVGEPAYSAPGTYIVKAYTDESVAWKNVPPGNHTFSAQVVNVDDMPFIPPVIAQNTINVPPAGNQTPELRLVSLQMDLTSPQSAQATPQPLAAAIAQVICFAHNFKINDDNIGQQNVTDEGHYIYYLDVEPPTIKGQPAITAPGTYKITAQDSCLWEGLTSGRHVFSVQLVNNDNTPLDTPVIVQIVITLPAEV